MVAKSLKKFLFWCLDWFSLKSIEVLCYQIHTVEKLNGREIEQTRLPDSEMRIRVVWWVCVGWLCVWAGCVCGLVVCACLVFIIMFLIMIMVIIMFMLFIILYLFVSKLSSWLYFNYSRWTNSLFTKVEITTTEVEERFWCVTLRGRINLNFSTTYAVDCGA